jgi:Fe-S-cluster containining protein
VASLNSRERLLRRGFDQFAICTQHCGAKCCRYVTVAISTPLSEDDWDEMRWWLSHEGVRVTKDDEGWMVEFETRCRHLGPSNACGIYENRMSLCERHDATDCEFALELKLDVLLESEADLADYLERRRLKRGKKIAKAIRAAERARPAPAANGLVQVQPLP